MILLYQYISDRVKYVIQTCFIGLRHGFMRDSASEPGLGQQHGTSNRRCRRLMLTESGCMKATVAVNEQQYKYKQV